MHGRLKVKTTEQQEKEKKIERAGKLKVYRQAMDTILNRRKEGLQDEMQLKLSAQVLQSNPDITTLWNIRKQVLLFIFQQDLDLKKDVKLNKELELTQSCLITNPKSYGAWYHRTWSLEHMEQPNWSNELALCNKFLQMDERNFHCWDYRKWIASKAEESCQKELAFTMEKIEENFSNYSAWHYRSKLLPILYPGDNINTIQENIIHSELELVQNAAFTDPDDSSAWFYHTWLLGREEENLSIIYCLIKEDCVTLAFTKPIKSTAIKVIIESQEVEMEWDGESEYMNNLWKSKLNIKSPVLVKVLIDNLPEQQVLEFRRSEDNQLMKGEGWKSTTNRFINLPSKDTEKVLKQALDNCVQLLELEPDSKWTLYTKVLILLALDSHKFHKDILESLALLENIDKVHNNYYKDMANKLIIEHCIENSQDLNIKIDQHILNSRIKYHAQYLPAFTIV